MAAASFPWAVHVADGAGLLVAPTVVLTARHVVEGEQAVDVLFPFLGATRRATVQVSDDADLALLRLTEPVDAEPAPIRPSRLNVGHRVLVPGNLTGGDDIPRVAKARFTAPVGGSLMQIDVEPGSGYSIQPGHSGGPVIDEMLGAVIGVCASREAKHDVKVGRFVAIERVAEVFPEMARWLGWRLSECRAEVGGDAPFSLLHGRLVHARRTHWLPRSVGARGGAASGVGADGRMPDLFHGRQTALDELDQFLGSGRPGAVFVTGDPGAGKSAVLARLVVERDPLLGNGIGRGCGYAFFAKDRSQGDLIGGVCDALGGPMLTELTDVTELVSTHRPFIAVDGLDEAAPGQVRSIVSAAVSMAEAGATVIIGARRSAIPRRFAGPTIDLDDDRYYSQRDLVAYSLDVLRRVDQPALPNSWRDDQRAPDEARAVAKLAGRNFLIAGLLALTRSTVEPGSPAATSGGDLPSVFDGLVDALDRQLDWEPR